jgi:hypothetical protein
MTPVEAYDHLRRLSQTKRLLRLSAQAQENSESRIKHAV